MFLIGLMGLGIDAGHVFVVAHQLQNAADAAALAGVQVVREGDAAARLAAINMAASNRADGAPVVLVDNPTNDINGDVVVGRYDRATREFRPALLGANSVKAVARRTESSPGGRVSLFFGSLFGIDSVEITRDAVAKIGGGTGAGIIALNEEKKNSLTVHGDVTLNTGEGDIQVNSNDSTQAAWVYGNAVVNAPAINVVGEPRLTGNSEFIGEVNTGVNVIPDPLRFVAPPTWDPANDLGTVSVTGGENLQIGPGYYSGGIAINNGSLVLEPGIYIVDGAGLNISGNATFLAEGVMFYFIGTGVVDLTGTNTVRITPPDPDLYSYAGVDTYENISFFQARDNFNDSRIIGTSLLDLEGTLYFPSNHLELGGTGEGFGNQLLADTIDIHGTGDMLIRYDGKEPAVGNRIYLVE